MKLRTAIALVAGFAVIAFILAHQDLAAIWTATLLAGWGLLPALGWRGVSYFLAGAAWRALFVAPVRPSLGRTSLARWIGESINTLLPVGQVGGDVVRGRLLRHDLVRADLAHKAAAALRGHQVPGSHGHGIPGGVSVAATVVADMTLNLLAQLIFALPGLWQLWHTKDLTLGRALGCLAVAAVPLGLLLLAQSPGVIRVTTGLARRLGLIKSGSTDAASPGGHLGLGFEQAVWHLYARHRAIAEALFWHLLAWICRAGETWMVLHLLGYPVSALDAVAIEGLLGAIRSAAFLMPAGLGVQEGALILLCGWVGVPADTALALALIKRARELVVGLPGLLAWLAAEHAAKRQARHA
jgi:putative membrane protein